MMPELKRIVFIGRDARMKRAIIELDHPSSRHRSVVIMPDDEDVHLLRDYRPGELRYIPVGASEYQLAFMRERGHTEISVAEAREWLKSKEPGHR